MAILTDDELVVRCKAELPGDTRSYEILVQRHMNRVYNLIYRIIGDREDAEDITQEVFVKVYNGLRKFEQQASFSTWLYRIATNAALDALDKIKRQRKSSHPPLTDAEPLLASTAGPEDAAMRRELRECINKVLTKIDRDQAQALVLRDFDNMSYDEIAAQLNLGLSAVKMRIHRARLAFQAIFSQTCMGAVRRENSACSGDSHKANTGVIR